ncbi:AGC/Akt protein kinase [Auriculariales sp. MPI-PUGE-AT-0066]|nr:AGC/Akt protein kinase [Auriculariales sp. MPI-PUGE-AT-0066]
MSSSRLNVSSGSNGASRSTTPRPANGAQAAAQSAQTTTTAAPRTSTDAHGLLIIQIMQGRGLQLPTGSALPDAVQRALAKHAGAGSRAAGREQGAGNHRESVQRKRNWWLPYVVLEFDKNEILIDAFGGDVQGPVWAYRAHFDVSRQSDISVSAYLRTEMPQHANAGELGNKDILIARVDLTPALDGAWSSDRWYSATAGTGEFRLAVQFRPSKNEPLTIEAFDLLKVIGKGSFGKVMQVRKKDTSRIYALKTIRKAHIAQRPGEITHILAERTVLALVNSPFIVPLKFSFQSPDKLYLVMSFVNGGELFYHLQREGRFDVHRSRFYAAELLSALEHLHSFNVVYRDLKPENILLDYTGHIALCDFGLCKLNMGEQEKTNTFCGTPEYIAPELLRSQGYTKTVDWWTLGVLLFEMMTGLPPFYDENVETMYQRILHDPLQFPPEMSSEARSIIVGLLNRDPNRRLGNNGGEEIKRHAFFSRYIDWNRLLQRKIQPPFKPAVDSALDVANFDAEFTSEAALDSVVEDSHLSETVQDQFRGFTYNPSGEHLSQSPGGGYAAGGH